MSDQELAELEACGNVECEYKVQSGVKDINHILKALNDHILATHPAIQKPAVGGSATSAATLPMLEQSILEYQAWMYRFDRYCTSCKLIDGEIKNKKCIFFCTGRAFTS